MVNSHNHRVRESTPPPPPPPPTPTPRSAVWKWLNYSQTRTHKITTNMLKLKHIAALKAFESHAVILRPQPSHEAYSPSKRTLRRSIHSTCAVLPRDRHSEHTLARTTNATSGINAKQVTHCGNNNLCASAESCGLCIVKITKSRHIAYLQMCFLHFSKNQASRILVLII